MSISKINNKTLLSSQRISLYASEDISSGSICNIYETDTVKITYNISSSDASKMLVLATSDVTSGSQGSFLLFGDSGDIFTGYTGSDILYIGSDGRPSADYPTTGNSIQRTIGYALDSTSIYFNPSKDYYEIESGSDFNLLDARWQIVTASFEGAGTIDLSVKPHVKVLLDGNFDTMYVDSSSIQNNVRHMFIFKTDGSDRLIINSNPNMFDNFNASFLMSGSERGQFELMKDIDGEIMFSGGPLE